MKIDFYLITLVFLCILIKVISSSKTQEIVYLIITWIFRQQAKKQSLYSYSGQTVGLDRGVIL